MSQRELLSRERNRGEARKIDLISPIGENAPTLAVAANPPAIGGDVARVAQGIAEQQGSAERVLYRGSSSS
jgi:hypothetical protein